MALGPYDKKSPKWTMVVMVAKVGYACAQKIDI